MLFPLRKTILAGKALLRHSLQTVLAPVAGGAFARPIMLASICGLLFLGILSSTAPQAFAAQTKPPYAESYYVTSSSNTTAYNLGCSQGHADSNWKANSLVVLDFGGQLADGSGVDNWDVGPMSNASVENVAEGFANGYQHCSSTTRLTLAVGTNNSAGDVSTSGGSTWAHVVSAVAASDSNNGFTRVSAMGGNDIEPSWGGANSWGPAEAWATGYSNVGSSLYVDYGSADGCPTTVSNDAACNNGWHQYGLWYVSWGAGKAVPAPQIYSDTMALQWQKISLYGAQNKNSRLDIWGPMSTPAYITPTQAWDDLSNALNSNSATAQNMKYLLEISWTW